MSDENIILVDWFAFSIPRDPPPLEAIKELIGLPSVKWLDRNGLYGYKRSLYFGGIWILYDGRDDMGVCVQMSGQGCRQFESTSLLSFAELFEIITGDKDRFHITRVDIAYDDIDKKGKGLLDITKICMHAYKGRFISKLTASLPQAQCVPDKYGNVERAHTCYFGSQKGSNVVIRFYDKAMERGGLDYHWVRCELQLRDDAAYSFLTKKVGWGERFFQVINNYLRFIVPNKNDTNRRRWPSPIWWTTFLHTLDRISLYTAKGVEYNLSRLERYVMDQAGNSIKTYIECVGLFHFLEVLNGRETELNPNQQALIAEYQALYNKKLQEYRKAHPWG